MNEGFLLQSGRPLPLLHRGALVLSFILLAVLATRQIGSLDAGFHLKAGDEILRGDGWPRTDPFTFTVKNHPYIDTSWGYQVAVAAVERATGSPGLVLFHLALVLAVFAILLRTARLGPVDPTLLVVLLLAGGLASEMRFEARPEILSWLFLAAVLWILHRRAAGAPSPLWALPAIHLLWANAHSLFILGWGALACFLVGTWIRDRRLDRGLFVASLLSVALAFVNPYGWQGVLFPFTLATRLDGGNLFGQTIGEFISPFALKFSEQFPFYPRVPITLFRALAVLGAVALVPLARRREYAACLLYLGALPLAAAMVRNMPLLVIASVPGTAWGLGAIAEHLSPRLGAKTRLALARGTVAVLAAAAVVLGLRVVHDAYYIDSRRLDRFGLGWNRLLLPVDAVRAAASMGLEGPVLNHLNFGGYLIWARPQPVFIDGRLEVMGEGFYRRYQRVLSSPDELEASVSRYGITWTIFPYALQPGLLARLSADSRWRLVYVDHLAAIFVRQRYATTVRIARGSVLAAALPVPLASLPGINGNPRPGPARRFLAGLLRSEEYPSEDFNLGLFHHDRGEFEEAERRFASAILKSGGAYYEIYSNLATVLQEKRRSEETRGRRRVIVI